MSRVETVEEKEHIEQFLEEAKNNISVEDESPYAKPYSKERVREIRATEKFKPYMILKTIIGWLGAFVALLILLLPFILISIVSFCADPGPVFFLQTRCGRNGKPFKVIKFRTMKRGIIHTHVSAQALTKEDYKKTSNGWQRWLRKTSLDELPQVFNILIGQMAWIGPRPIMYNEYLVIERRIENGAIHCKPGLSGLAQVNGRRAIDYIVKANFDGEYYQKFGLWIDIKLFFKTIFYVFERKDAA